MTYESFINLFSGETNSILQRQQWTIDTQNVFEKLRTKVPEALGRALVASFASSISEGEVSQELFTFNWNRLNTFLDLYATGDLKSLLETNVDPQIYLTPEDLLEKLKQKFEASLQKTTILKKKEEEAGNLLEGLGMLKSLEGFIGGREQRRQRTRTLRKKNKRK